MTTPVDYADADAAADLHQRGLSHAAIADQLGIAVGAVPTYILTGRRHLDDLAHQDQLSLFG